MPISVRDFDGKVISKLRQKFDIKILNRHHVIYEMYYQGKFIIRTRRSHGAKELSDTILGNIKRHLFLDKTHQLYELRDCSMSAEDYLMLLRGKGVI